LHRALNCIHYREGEIKHNTLTHKHLRTYSEIHEKIKQTIQQRNSSANMDPTTTIAALKFIIIVQLSLFKEPTFGVIK